LKLPDWQLLMSENILKGFFSRLEQLMKHYGVSTVNELAIKHLKYDAPQKINRLKKEGNSPSAEIIADILRLWPEVNANWLLVGAGPMLHGQVNKIETKAEKEPSMNSVLLVLAEGYKAQVETIKSIESKMAQEQTQAMINKSVQKIVTSLPELADRLENGFAIVIELLKRDALREAKGSQERARQILGEILQRIGPDLTPKMQEGIRSDGHR